MRSQQRGIPPFIDQLLDLYGHEEHVGTGRVMMYLDKASIREMERDMGREPVRRMGDWLRAFKIKSAIDGATITIGHRHKHIKRK